MNEVWDAWVAPEATPARATVQVTQLADPGWKLGEWKLGECKLGGSWVEAGFVETGRKLGGSWVRDTHLGISVGEYCYCWPSATLR